MSFAGPSFVPTQNYVVCDHCGYFHGHRDPDEIDVLACESCGGQLFWTFPDLRLALAQAASINPDFRWTL